MPSVSPRKIELLAPARDTEIARKAIACGADAIYIGPSSHGARAAAGNSVEDIASLVKYAHPFGVRIYATVNTIVYDNEIHEVERLISDLYRAGVDALIVQDMGILRMNIPPIDLHASTQCDIRSVEKARFLASVGFSRVVLARELSAMETVNRTAFMLPQESFNPYNRYPRQPSSSPRVGITLIIGEIAVTTIKLTICDVRISGAKSHITDAVRSNCSL